MITTIDNIMSWACGDRKWNSPCFQMENSLSMLGSVPESRSVLSHLWENRWTHVECRTIGHGEEYPKLIFGTVFSIGYNTEFNDINKLKILVK